MNKYFVFAFLALLSAKTLSQTLDNAQLQQDSRTKVIYDSLSGKYKTIEEKTDEEIKDNLHIETDKIVIDENINDDELSKKFPVINRPDEEVLVYGLRLKRYSLTDSLLIYQDDNGNILVPLSAFVSAMEFPIKVDAKKGIAKGYFLNPDRKFDLNLNEGRVISDSKRIGLKKGDVERHENDIYVAPTLLSELFPLNAEVNDNELVLIVKSAEPMPLEIRKAAEERRKRVNKNKEKEDYGMAKLSTDAFTYPSVDVTVSDRYNRNSELGTSSNSLSYAINGASIFYGYDAMWSINGSNDTDAIFRGRARKYQPYETMVYFKDIEFGDISSSDMSLISNSTSGRGIFMSSLADSRVGKDKTVNLTGFLQNGYEVELYKNEVIIDFITDSNSGMYEFKDIPVEEGLNIFKILFIGPNGEQREEEKRIFVSSNLAEKGKVEVTGSITQDKKYLIETDETSNESDNAKVNLNVMYGISSSSSVSLGFSKQNDVIDNELSKNFFSAGLKTSLLGNGLEYYLGYGKDSTAPAQGFILSSKIFNWGFFGKYEIYNNLNSEASYLYGKYADSLLEGRLNGSVVIPLLGRYPMFFRYKKSTIEDDITHEELSAEEITARISHSISKINLSVEGNELNNYDDTKTSTISIKASTTYDIISLRTEYLYGIEPKEQPKKFSIRSDFKASKTLNTFYEWQTNYDELEQKTHTISWGLNNKTKYGNFGVGFSSDTKDNVSFSVSYSLGFIHNPRANKYETTGYNNVATTGSISAKVFLDKNNDGVFGDDDEGLSDVEIASNASTYKDLKTNENGEVFIIGASAYDKSYVKIKPENLKDISYKVIKEKNSVIARPGSSVKLDIPIIQTSEIEGQIYTKIKKDIKPIQGIIINAVNDDGKIISSAITDYDGYFVILNVPYGNYKLSFDAPQMKELGYNKAQKTKKIIVEEPIIALEDKIILQK